MNTDQHEQDELDMRTAEDIPIKGDGEGDKDGREWRLRQEITALETIIRTRTEQLMGQQQVVEGLREEVKFLRSVVLNLSQRRLK